MGKRSVTHQSQRRAENRSAFRQNRVYVIGGGILLFLQLTVVPASNTAAWQAAAHALGHLAG
jgi:hypothetical protein